MGLRSSLIALALLLGGIGCALAQRGGDDNLANPTQLVTVKRDGYSIAALVTHLEGAKGFKYGIALFPGHPGIMRLREEEGSLKFNLGGNMLVRSRRWWLDEETLVAVLDAPSDQWNSFSQRWRESPRYGADISALLTEIGSKFSINDWTFVGTSEGSISAFHAGRMHPELAKRVILTSSVIRAGRNGPGLSSVNYAELKSKLLWVNHEDDPCQFTLYHLNKTAARSSGAPLVTVRGGGPSRGDDCQAYTAHGFVGVEKETVLAMRSWVKTGNVPADVQP
jgi:hypothetical protein